MKGPVRRPSARALFRMGSIGTEVETGADTLSTTSPTAHSSAQLLGKGHPHPNLTSPRPESSREPGMKPRMHASILLSCSLSKTPLLRQGPKLREAKGLAQGHTRHR